MMKDCRLIGLQLTEIYFSQFCRPRHPRSGCLHDLILMRELFWFSDCRLLIFTWQKAGKGILRSPFYKNTNPIQRAPLSWPNFLPKVLPSLYNELEFQHKNLRDGSTDIQYLACISMELEAFINFFFSICEQRLSDRLGSLSLDT